MTTNNNICKNQAYLNAIDQKQRMAFLNIPPPRYNNLANNPYQIIDPSTNQYYTQYQLDMRRKVEILKYSSNRMSTQTNSLTKAQKYAQLVNGSYQQRTYTQSYLNKILADISNGIHLPSCPIVYTPSTSSNIPGPAIQLVEDDTIPLYNLTNDVNRAAFGIINHQTTGNIWNYTKLQDIPLIDNNFVTVTSLYIINTNFATDVFSLSIPISANISATTINNNIYSYQSDISFSIIHAYANIVYSYSNVTLKEQPVYTLNMNPLPSSPIDLSINMINDTSFNIHFYVGKLQIENLYLYTQTGYIYDIQIQMNYLLKTDNNYINFFNNPSVTLFANSKNDVFQIHSINESSMTI